MQEPICKTLKNLIAYAWMTSHSEDDKCVETRSLAVVRGYKETYYPKLPLPVHYSRDIPTSPYENQIGTSRVHSDIALARVVLPRTGTV